MFTLNIPKMRCAGCVNTIKNAILKVDKSAVIEVILSAQTVNVQTISTEEDIIQALTDVGYKPTK